MFDVSHQHALDMSRDLRKRKKGGKKKKRRREREKGRNLSGPSSTTFVAISSLSGHLDFFQKKGRGKKERGRGLD